VSGLRAFKLAVPQAAVDDLHARLDRARWPDEVAEAPLGISLKEISVEVWPFLIALLIALALIIAFPQIVLWVPTLFGCKPGS